MFSRLQAKGVELSFFEIDVLPNNSNLAEKLLRITIRVESHFLRPRQQQALQMKSTSEDFLYSTKVFFDASEINQNQIILNFVGEEAIGGFSFIPKVITAEDLLLGGRSIRALWPDYVFNRDNFIIGTLRMSSGIENVTKLLKFELMTEKYLSANLVNLRATAVGLLELLVLESNLLKKFKLFPDAVTLGTSRGFRLRHFLKYFIFCISVFLFNKLKKIFQFDLSWRVELEDSRIMNHITTTVIGPKDGSKDFCADPFVWEYGGKIYCFFEYYDWQLRLGKISYICLDDDTPTVIHDALTEDFHLSFPFMFEYEGTIYMCPETSSINEIRLYRCSIFPNKWEYSTTLMKDIDAADTVIFEKNGLWWLLSNVDFTRRGIHTNFLNAYYAESPLSSEWTPHVQNPLSMTTNSARNGGFFMSGDKTMRVGQIQGFNFYGKSAALYEILTLSEESFSEVRRELPPSIQVQNKHGFHHLDMKKEVLAYDLLLPRRSSRA